MVSISNLSNSTLCINMSKPVFLYRLRITKETIQPNQDPATSIPLCQESRIKNQCSYAVSFFVSILGVPVVDLPSKII